MDPRVFLLFSLCFFFLFPNLSNAAVQIPGGYVAPFVCKLIPIYMYMYIRMSIQEFRSWLIFLFKFFLWAISEKNRFWNWPRLPRLFRWIQHGSPKSHGVQGSIFCFFVFTFYFHLTLCLYVEINAYICARARARAWCWIHCVWSMMLWF